MTIRLYFNAHGPLPWSVDFGDQTTERHLSSVEIEGVLGITHYAGQTEDGVPCAWVEFHDAKIQITGNFAFISADA